jgi:RNA polymerase sigma-70 factor (ECF subfamily)
VQLDDDDGEAILRCQRGDIGGLEPLMARYQVPALRLAYLLVGERATAEDIVQDSFLLAYQGLAHFRPGSAFAPWFYRIVTNTARQQRRRAATRHEISVERLPSDNEAATSPIAGAPGLSDRDPQGDPAIHAERREEREDVLRALAELTQKQREAIVLRYYFSCSDHELAAMLGCREGTARQRLHGGLAALKQIITRRYAWLDVTAPTPTASPPPQTR